MPNTTMQLIMELRGSAEGPFAVTIHAEGLRDCDAPFDAGYGGKLVMKSGVAMAQTTAPSIRQNEKRLSFSGWPTTRLAVTITDAAGRMVREMEIDSEKELDLKELNGGAYFVRASRAGVSSSIKILSY
jgi:hypothetical protein